MKTKLVPLFLLVLFVTSCASRPLIYDEMTPEERDSEASLQGNITNTAETIANAGFKFIDNEEERTKIADSVCDAIEKVLEVLGGDTNKDVLTTVLDAFKQISPSIREMAKDAFDLFAGWIDIPNLNDVLPEVIRDRLNAFLLGALAGLQEYRSPS